MGVLEGRRKNQWTSCEGAMRPRDITPDAPGIELERLRGRLHDSTLQTLEYIASGGLLGNESNLEDLMRAAAREANELRRYLAGAEDAEQVELAAAVRREVTRARLLADHEIRVIFGSTQGWLCGPTCQDFAAAVREALTNARKHAGASCVTVFCEETSTHALVTIKDDGTGTDLERVQPRIGLRHSIFDRMARLGGSARIRSAPGAGTLVELRLDAAAHEACADCIEGRWLFAS
jgi:signal transduction histidine kinase